jgi:hypothetical protein
MGLAVACQWLWNFVMLEVTPTGIANIGWKFYIVFAVFNAAFVPIVYFLYPETAGLSLEAVDLLFMDRSRSPVASANALFKAKKSGAPDSNLEVQQEMSIVEKKNSAAPSVSRVDNEG